MLKVIHYGSALGSTWAVVQGDLDDNVNAALDMVTAKYGGMWMLPILEPEQEKTWASNPKVITAIDGTVELVWLFKQV